MKRIEIVGPLGIGKTTLLNTLCQADNVAIIHEDLKPLVGLIESWHSGLLSSYHLQSAFYLNAFKQCNSLCQGSIALSDFALSFHHSGYSKMMFQDGRLTSVEWSLLEDLHDALKSSLPPVCGMIYCHASVDTILKRISTRGRPNDMTQRKIVERLDRFSKRMSYSGCTF